MQVIALVFSFSIGKVKIKGLNDAKFITVAVYVTSIVTAVIFVSLYSLKTYLNLYATLFSFGFFVGTTFILALVFLPKVHALIASVVYRTLIVWDLRKAKLGKEDQFSYVDHEIVLHNNVLYKKHVLGSPYGCLESQNLIFTLPILI